MKITYDPVLDELCTSDAVIPPTRNPRSNTVKDSVLGLVTPLDDVGDCTEFYYPVESCSGVLLKIVSADPDATGNIVLIANVGGADLPAFTLPVTADLVWHNLAFSVPKSGRLVIRRDHANAADTFKADGAVITAIIANVKLLEA